MRPVYSDGFSGQGLAMTLEESERDIQEAYARLATATATVRHCQEHYLDDFEAAYRTQQQALQEDHEREVLHSELAVQAGVLAAQATRDHAATSFVELITSLIADNRWLLSSWDDHAWLEYQPDVAAPAPTEVRIGRIDFSGVAGLPDVPAMAPLVGHGHLLITAKGMARPIGRSLLQAVTLRVVTSTRPGSIRLALADPLGQGQHLSGFLRLPAALRVGERVAASPAEVETLLRGLVDHMIDVTQTRLTNVHDSLEDYNAATTGVEVPYQILVITEVPAGITERSAELLVNLARNGPRAGVYIFATLDRTQTPPRGFDVADLTALATNLAVDKHAQMSSDDPTHAGCLLSPDRIPDAATVNPWLDAVGAVASATSQNLPFDQIAVAPGERWRGNTIDGLDVQIGVDSRGDPQHFVIGRGSVHHGLLGGDVQTGKSSLLHVLLTQLALRYPPEELELYLLDFKEVEFDRYLTARLPHGRAIASRTDREFGLSLLRRFHTEIERRSQLFRDAGVSHFRDYRRQTGTVLPRALVVMDEFQVLFPNDDRGRLSGDASALLEDIARRGASFGLNLLLASQSPGGHLRGYLERVYEQMALRIALRCQSPIVSQGVLGEGNDAATRLTQPGDAIYNDRGIDGSRNPKIRIAHLTNEERQNWLEVIHHLADGRTYQSRPNTG